jgi:Type II secretion system (T2SS), protein F
VSAPPWRVALAALLLVVLAAALTAEPEARRTYLVLATAQDRGTDLSDALLDLSKDLRAQRRDDLQQEAARRRLWLIIPIVLILAPMCRLGLDPVGRSVESGLPMGRVVRGISDVSLELPWGVSRSTITSRSEKGVARLLTRRR